jgi:hypothetical protein
MKLPDLKHCPICDKDLPVSEFGICRARKNGRNLYCKACICEKVKIQRAGLKEMSAKRKAAQLLNGLITRKPSVLAKITPADKVLNAVSSGARTQDEIRWKTRLDKDVIGDALAELILDLGKVVSISVGERRYYFTRESFGLVIKHEGVA